MRTDRFFWALAMLGLALIIRYFPQNYGLMLVRSFAFQFLVAFTLVSAYWAYRGRALNVVLGILSVFVLNSFLPPILTDDEGALADREGLVVAHFNVLMVNKDYGSTIAQALNSNADLISFQEVDERWTDSLQDALRCTYPYVHVEAQANFHGIAVFSKKPFQSVNTFYSYGDPSIEGSVLHDGQEVHFIAVHARSPIPHFNYVKRDKQLLDVEQRMNNLKGPKLLIGDLNAVPWDEQVVKLRLDTGLMDGRTSVASTFPSYIGAAGIPIDHILHSHEFRCVGFQTIAGMGSDHMGILGVFQLTG